VLVLDQLHWATLAARLGASAARRPARATQAS
jgi:hypothetical protein